MNFDNIFEYKIEVHKAIAVIEMHEIFESATRFTPRDSTLEFLPGENGICSCQLYYSIFPSFTFRYKVHIYKINNPNILSLDYDECFAFLQDYVRLILKYQIQPDDTEKESRRFKGTPDPVPLKSAEQAKIDALARFQKIHKTNKPD